MEQLYMLQKQSFKQLQNFSRCLREMRSDSVSIGMLQTRSDVLNDYFQDFRVIDTKLTRTAVSENIAFGEVKYFKENLFSRYETLYFETKAYIVDELRILDPSMLLHSTRSQSRARENDLPHVTNVDTSFAEVKLPKINLPSFSGNYTELLSFRDLFTSLIHIRRNLTGVEKLQYLKLALSGEAQQLLKHIAITESNYEFAWHTLNNRYDNKRMMVDYFLRKFLEQSTITNESHIGIRKLLDETRECLASLESLKVSIDTWDPLIVYTVVKKLDVETRKKWEFSLEDSTELPTLEQLYKFLESTFRTLEALNSSASHAKSTLKPVTNKHVFNNPRKFSRTFHVSNDPPCPVCKKPHFVYKCWTFKAYSRTDKDKFMKNNFICSNCLVPGHNVSDCHHKASCHICKERHHTMLHIDHPNSSNTPETSSTLTRLTNTVQFAHRATLPQKILLATISVKIITKAGEFILRALLDQGSQASFITERAVQILRLPKTNTHLTIGGVGGNSLQITKKCCQLILTSLHDPNAQLPIQPYVLKSLTTLLPSDRITALDLPANEHYDLADHQYNQPGSIDFPSGADVYPEIISEGHIKLNNGPLLQNSIFGWIISGPINPLEQCCTDSAVSMHLCTNVEIDTLLRTFWEDENISSINRIPTTEETLCESHFSQTHQRSPDGKYTVSLPFRSIITGAPIPNFGKTHLNALMRLRAMERVFIRKPNLHLQYADFMREYETLGHMRFIEHYTNATSTSGYYLPHHAIIKEESTTTKLRVVFDGSSTSSLPGPALQRKLPDILMRWRRHRYAFLSDVEKMFRQIKIHSDDTKYQRIFWREYPADLISIYELNTVTYGTTPAPYLAIRTLLQLANDEKDKYPKAHQVLLKDVYVDDIISGGDDLLTAGGFHLRKWMSNCKEILQAVPPEDQDNSHSINVVPDGAVKALGLFWFPNDDQFSFKVNLSEEGKMTKRGLLSDTAKLFDPLGWLSPAIIMAKMFLQKLWLAGTSLDEPLPLKLREEWYNYRMSLPELQHIKLPRWLGMHSTSELQIHGFCDSSESAYAAVLYARVRNSDGTVIVHLLRSKTKVAPLKRVCLPRLELCGAVILSRLVRDIKQTLNVPDSLITLWTDSTVTLAWIKGMPHRWKVYVANRVTEIQSHTNAHQWLYIQSKDNPADCASRGVMPNELLSHPLWWTGPPWLCNDVKFWPKHSLSDVDTSLEERTIAAMYSTSVEYPEELSHFSSFQKTVRILAYCYRWKLIVMESLKSTGYLKPFEYQQRVNRLLRLTQKIDFPNEYSSLLNNKPIDKKSRLISLAPFIDKSGIIRVGGRLRHAPVEENVKHQIVLSNQNPLAKLLLCDAHIAPLHGGAQLTLSYIRQAYWIISPRNLVKRYIHQCTLCFKYNAKSIHQLMGDLPSVRVTPTRPFKHSGVDFAGPIEMQMYKGRNPRKYKAYICIFLCLVTKAVHIEAVTSLSTDGFIAAFRRFISRRGACTELYSDCGTNFVGADTRLGNMHRQGLQNVPTELVDTLLQERVNWHFIPPASPNFGGLWEAGVKSVKHHLRRVLQDKSLTYEEMSTLLTQIESCLNSRPLSPMSNDPNDLNVLTPAHFLVGEPTTSLIEPDISLKPQSLVSRWHEIQRMMQHFWHRWSTEYLSRLQQRPKWRQIIKDPLVGDLVLVRDERYPPSKWPIARITQTHQGKDGLIRVVTVNCKGRTIQRPISKLCYLPEPEDLTGKIMKDNSSLAGGNVNAS